MRHDSSKAKKSVPTMLRRFQAMKSPNAHAVLPQSERFRDVEEFVQRGYVRSLVDVISYCIRLAGTKRKLTSHACTGSTLLRCSGTPT